MAKIKGFTKKNQIKNSIPRMPFRLKAVPHNEEMPVPKPLSEADIENSSSKESLGATGMDVSHEPEPKSEVSLAWSVLNDLVRDLNF